MRLKSVFTLLTLLVTTYCGILCNPSMALGAAPSRCESRLEDSYSIKRQPQTNPFLGMSIVRTSPRVKGDGQNNQERAIFHSSDKLIYVHSGRGVIRFSDQNYTLSTGSIIFIPAGISYVYEATASDLITMESYNTSLDQVEHREGPWTMTDRHPLVTHLNQLPDWSEWQEGNPVLTRFVVDGTQDYPHSSMVFGFAKIPYGAELMRHKHPDDHFEAYYILEGTATSFINDEPFELNSGSGLFIEGGAYHHTKNLHKEDLIFFFVFPNEDSFSNVEYIIEAK